MPTLAPGVYRFGPDDSVLTVTTSRTGAAAKAGHDLIIDVTSWEGTLEIGNGGAPNKIALEASGASLRVREGVGGMKPLGDDDKSSIEATIDGILERQPILFRSTAVELDVAAGLIRARGDMIMLGTARPVEFDLRLDRDGRLSATVGLKQTDWGIKPYSTLFGALQVADDFGVRFETVLAVSNASA
jgi:hypothetical protein